MAAKCPICKTNKMRFGGMVALDGTFCGKCYDKAIKKGIDHNLFSKLKVHEIAEYIENVPAEETEAWVKGIEKLREETKKNRELRLPLLQEFRESSHQFFASKGLEENSSLQNYATQIFWHVNKLRKIRLMERGLILDEQSNHDTVQTIEDYMEKNIFDGKYEISQITETIDGSIKFYRDDQCIYEDKNYNQAQYILQNVHMTDNSEIVCPSCGQPASRSNLIDGCDYCGSKFTVEDLESRIAEYHIKKNIDTQSYDFLYSSKDEKAGSIITGLLLFLSIFIFGERPDFLTAFFLLLVSPLFGWLVYFFGFKFLVLMFYLFRGNYQSSLEYEREEMRRDQEIIDRIRRHDPLFAVEEFYAEVKNMVTAHFYAKSNKQVVAFWENPNEKNIDDILNENQNVINVDMVSIGMMNYTLKDSYQYIDICMSLELLRDFGKNKIKKDKEDFSITLVKSANCKTQAICEPKMLICPGCGSSISFMEGCRCHYCGTGLKLSDMGWALMEMNGGSNHKIRKDG